MNTMKNKLIQYKGGGYDGCFWEWNYCFIDSSGEFHDIFSSGRMAITSLEQLQQRIKEEDIDYIYSTKSKKDLKEFVTECNEDNVLTVAKWFTENRYNGELVTLTGICNDCKQEFNLAYGLHTGYKGNGGIGVQYTGMVCEDCYYGYSCSDCGEYIGSEGLTYIDSEGDYCEDCLEKHATIDLPKVLINQVLFDNSGFELEQVIAFLKSYIKRDVLNDITDFDSLDKFAKDNNVEFKALDSNNGKLWGFFTPDYQLPNPNQLNLEL